MPEGHTLHRLARLHQRRFGRTPVTVSSPQGRFTDGAAAVDGRVLRKATAWGKHLFHHYDGGRVVHVHLGLYGTFTEAPVPMPLPVGQVRMRMVGAEYGTDLNPRSPRWWPGSARTRYAATPIPLPRGCESTSLADRLARC
jgi:endonuclease-8